MDGVFYENAFSSGAPPTLLKQIMGEGQLNAILSGVGTIHTKTLPIRLGPIDILCEYDHPYGMDRKNSPE